MLDLHSTIKVRTCVKFRPDVQKNRYTQTDSVQRQCTHSFLGAYHRRKFKEWNTPLTKIIWSVEKKQLCSISLLKNKTEKTHNRMTYMLYQKQT